LDGGWRCFGPVQKLDGKPTQIKICQSCKISAKKCEGGLAKVPPPPGDTVYVNPRPSATTAPRTPSVVVAPPKARPRKDKGPVAAPTDVEPPRIDLRTTAVDTSSFSTYDLSGARMGTIYTPSAAGSSSQASSSRKRMALGPPSEAGPSSLKSARTSGSSSAAVRTSSIASSSRLPFDVVSMSSSRSFAVSDRPDVDELLVRLDAVEMSLHRGDINEARRRVANIRESYAKPKRDNE